MSIHVSLRPLREDDAYVSFRWRNIPELWRFTARAPDREIRVDDELAWIRKVIGDPTSRRFAIEADGTYVGNIYLTDIRNGGAEYHIFIGDRDFRGRGVARQASEEVIQYARQQLGLTKIELGVHEDNEAAISLYESLHFVAKGREGRFVRMELRLLADGDRHPD